MYGNIYGENVGAVTKGILEGSQKAVQNGQNARALYRLR